MTTNAIIPLEFQETVLTFLMWVSSGLMAVLVAILVWIALGVIGRLDTITKESENQFSTFGKQLAELNRLLTAETHQLDNRLVKLEEWRRSREGYGIDQGPLHHARQIPID